MKRRRWIWAVLLLLAVGIVLLLNLRESVHEDARTVAVAAPKPEPRPKSDAPMTRLSGPLPGELKPGESKPAGSSPFDIPVRERLPALRARADAGDARARCLLSVEYAQCELIPAMLESVMGHIEDRTRRIQALPANDPAKADGERWIAQNESRLAKMQQLSQHCDGVEIPPADEIVRLMRESGEAGQPGAAEVYVSGAMFELGTSGKDAGETRRYLDSAEAMAQAAAVRGSIVSAWLLAEAYLVGPDDGVSPTLRNAVRKDPAAGLSLYHGVRETLLASPQSLKTRVLLESLDERIAQHEKKLPRDVVDAARAKPFRVPQDPSGQSLRRAALGNMTSPTMDGMLGNACD
jgi:hypothetical protein